MYVIADRWYVVLSSAELGATSPVAARRLGLPLVFWRARDGQPQAAIDVCPHRGAALSPGLVVDGELECPFHGHRFSGDGDCTAVPAHPERKIPAAMKLSALQVREAHGFVWVWSGTGPAPAAPIDFFDFTGFSASGSELTADVATSYTRAIENQLDFAHLAFVHRTTIGRGLAGPEVDLTLRTDGDRITAHMAGMAPDSLEFRGPCIWRLRTGPVWQFLAFVPVDETHMRYYVRTYQPWLGSGPLAWVVGKVGAVLNARVFHEDTVVVETQPPGETRLRSGEVLVPSDGAIVAYRRWREAHRVEVPFQPPRAAGGPS